MAETVTVMPGTRVLCLSSSGLVTSEPPRIEGQHRCPKDGHIKDLEEELASLKWLLDQCDLEDFYERRENEGRIKELEEQLRVANAYAAKREARLAFAGLPKPEQGAKRP